MRREHYDGRPKGKDPMKRGAKTFRRGRAIAFLETMNIRRTAIKKQLAEPEFLPIQPVLLGELKALDLVIDEFTQLFEIHQDEMENRKSEEEAADDKKGRETLEES